MTPIWMVVTSIPVGRLLTYGQVAEARKEGSVDRRPSCRYGTE